MGRARGLVCASAILCLVSLTVCPAIARERIPTDISMHNFIGGAEGFEGEVFSDPGCVRNRVVKLKYDAPPGYRDQSRTNRTNSDGEWRIEFKGHKPNPGEYQAIAKKKELSRDFCKQGRSKTIDIHV